MKSGPSKREILYLRVFIVAIILTIASGWIFTDFLGRFAEKEFTKKVDRDINLNNSFLHDNLDDATKVAKVLSQSEAIVAALSSGSSENMERANMLLDRVNKNYEMSVCYLMDRNGLTVASSNRNENNGFAGKSFASRPYFMAAAAGRLTTYFALGLVSRERGYYAAAPVVDSNGTITGVVTVKKDVAQVEKFFEKHTHTFLVSPEGIIFITSMESYLFRSLWPVDERKRSELLGSRQFGNITFEPLLTAEPQTGTYVRFENEEHYILRLPFGSDGWTLVSMEAPRIVSNYRMFGMLISAVFALLLLFFFTLLRYKSKSLEAARELLKSKDDWKLTFDTVPELIAIIDADHRITSVNRAMAERLDISQKEAVGRHCYELLHGYQDLLPSCPHKKMLMSGKVESEQKCLKGDFIVTTVPVLAKDGTIESYILVMHDVTDMKRLNNEVNRINNLKSIGLLSGGLAHDFNNVLNVIYGNISFAKMLAKGNTAIVEPLTDAEEACKRAKELGLRLQAFSQGNSPDKELITLPAIIEEVAKALFDGSHISHTLSAAVDILPVEADPRQIRQVFENLLTNAKEAMSEGGSVNVEIKNYVVDGKTGLPLGSGYYVCIVLQDDGQGIPQENLLKIFDPYFSTKDTYSQRGMGLGLTICHAILKRHGGHISAESRVGIGTRVALYLPASVEENQLTPGYSSGA